MRRETHHSIISGYPGTIPAGGACTTLQVQVRHVLGPGGGEQGNATAVRLSRDPSEGSRGRECIRAPEHALIELMGQVSIPNPSRDLEWHLHRLRSLLCLVSPSCYNQGNSASRMGGIGLNCMNHLDASPSGPSRPKTGQCSESEWPKPGTRSVVEFGADAMPAPCWVCWVFMGLWWASARN